MTEIYQYSIIKDSTELRKLIAENPELPIVVLVGSDAAWDDYAYTYCTCVSCFIDEILDCEPPFYNEGFVVNDKEDFRERMEEWLLDQDDRYAKMSDAEFDVILTEELKKYEPYWKKCICIRADN